MDDDMVVIRLVSVLAASMASPRGAASDIIKLAKKLEIYILEGDD